MLCLTRSVGEEIKIGPDIRLVVVSIDRGRVKLGLVAPKDVKIIRSELGPWRRKEGGDDND